MSKVYNKLSDHSIGVVILAAGRGERMGGEPKLLLPMRDGRPILRHAVENALAFQPTEVVVVVRPDVPALAEALRDLPVRCEPNPRYREGMSTSLQNGIAALGEGTAAALVMLGDEPSVSPAIIEALVAAYVRQHKPLTIPLYGDQAGPPTLFARSIFPDLHNLRGDAGGRQLVARHPDQVCFVPLSADARPTDIDTPQDYEAMVADSDR